MVESICDKCDKECLVSASLEGEEIIVSGNECSLGKDFAETYFKSPKGILTTLVRIKGSNDTVISVKSSKPIDKKLFIKCSIALSRIYVGAPIKIGDVVCKNILNTGVDIVCTRNSDKSI